MIGCYDVAKVYRQDGVDTPALRWITIEIDTGEHVAITGPSGSGKSTLLALMGALDRPTSGKLTVDGMDLGILTPAERSRYRFEKVGFVFQEFHLLSHLTVLENVLAPFLGRAGERSKHQVRAKELLGVVGLSEALTRPAGVLSGGEKQRVAIARALVNDPDLILCDEPTGNLDSVNGEIVTDLLKRLAETASGKTLVVVTHDPKVAGRFARQIKMQDGRVVV
ncbi:MAG: ABC transporter ATP-binding protein [Thermaerobacter sp.]|nr:ABC transporter ATP-binding protein [Thermaerobacter sp.]